MLIFFSVLRIDKMRKQFSHEITKLSGSSLVGFDKYAKPHNRDFCILDYLFIY